MSGHYLGTAVADEYMAVTRILSFLIGTVGWKVAEDVTDTGTVRDVVLVSPGEPEVPNGFPRYIRIRNDGATSNIWLHTYETFLNTTTNTGELSDGTYGAVFGSNDAQGFELNVIADLERVIINVFQYTGVNTYTGYVGRINSYYRANEHKYPNLVKGSTSTSITWYYSATEANCFMIGPHGSKQHYYAVEPLNSIGLDAGQSSDRDGTLSLAAPVLVNNNVDTQRSELTGEPRGIYRIPSNVSEAGSFLKINDKVYIVFVQSGVHMAMGPVGTEVPSFVTNLTA